MKSLQETHAPHGRCFGCGPANDRGLRIQSFADGDVVKLDWTPEKHHEAFDGVLNGGIIGAQYYTIHNGAARSVTISVDWSPFGPASSTGSFLDPDVDVMLVSGVGAYGTQIGTAFQAATGAKPQVATASLAANTNYLLVVIYYDQGATVTDPTAVSITIR